MARPRFTVPLADDADRQSIYHERHTVYAEELRQHSVNAAGELRDAAVGGEPAGPRWRRCGRWKIPGST